ncbi:MAG TPA: class IV adenylate cyclase [Candidatus Acidoferrum sp.]|nr:class IV adenylate cyclase [Candidatus Acidoferrum sp.]
MAYETEIKLRIEDVRALRRVLKRMGAQLVGPGSGRVHEMNLIFDTPEGGLAKHGQLLRIRRETPESGKRGKAGKSAPRVMLTFKSPPEELAMGEAAPAVRDRRHKVRQEIEVVLTDAMGLQKIFEGLGLRGWFRYEKYRTTYRLPGRVKWAQGLLLELDETPVGTFLELEGPGEAIDRAAKELGYGTKDYILKNYLVLYVEDCRRKRVAAGDMVFGGK